MMMDWTYGLVLVGAVLCLAASGLVNTTYRKYAKVFSACGKTGREVAEEILLRNGITDVQVRHVGGQLTDHYDPAAKVVNLSDATYNSSSIAAVSVAAHECGHVCQHSEGYMPLKLRTAIVPAANIGSRAGLPLVVLGLILGYFQPLITVGIVMFSAAVLFQLVTLPVEFNASSRAIGMLCSYGLLAGEEEAQAEKVLRAAALTYVAAAASSILQLLRLIMISQRGSSRRRS